MLKQISAVLVPSTKADAGAVWHYGDPFGEQRAAKNNSVIIDRSHSNILLITGKDRRYWLNSISSQYVSDLSNSMVTENLILSHHGHIENHWTQTELDKTIYLKTEPWKGTHLLNYLNKMIFWADIRVRFANMSVLSLLGPGIADSSVLKAIGIEKLPNKSKALQLSKGGLVWRLPGKNIRLDIIVPRNMSVEYIKKITKTGVRPAGIWTYESIRVESKYPRLNLDADKRTIPHELNWIGIAGRGAVHINKGCYKGQETVARVHNLGKSPRMLVILHLAVNANEYPTSGDLIKAKNYIVGRIGTVVEHFLYGPIALALIKTGIHPDTQLFTGVNFKTQAKIDLDTLPKIDHTAGLGRIAIQKLRKSRQKEK